MRDACYVKIYRYLCETKKIEYENHTFQLLR